MSDDKTPAEAELEHLVDELEDLEDRLDAVRGPEPKNTESVGPMSDAASAELPAKIPAIGKKDTRRALQYLYVGMVFPAAIVIGFLVGRLIGSWLGSGIFGALVGLFLGAGAGFYNLFQTMQRVEGSGDQAP